MCKIKKILTILLVLLIVMISCNKQKPHQTNKRKSSKKIISIDNILVKVLDKYLQYFSEKDINKIVSLYSSNPGSGLLTKTALKEMFSLSDKLTYTKEKYEVKKVEDNQYQIKYILIKQILVGPKKIIEKSENLLLLTKEANQWKIKDEKILRIIN